MLFGFWHLMAGFFLVGQNDTDGLVQLLQEQKLTPTNQREDLVAPTDITMFSRNPLCAPNTDPEQEDTGYMLVDSSPTLTSNKLGLSTTESVFSASLTPGILSSPDYNPISKLLPESPQKLTLRLGYLDMLQLLLVHGYSANEADSTSGTPMHLACALNNLAAVKLLARHGADVNAVDQHGHTPLMFAIYGNHLEVVRYLVDKLKADINVADPEGRVPFIQATCLSHVEVLTFLSGKRACRSNAIDNQGRTALHWACAIGNLDVLDVLLRMARVSVFVRTHEGDSPLHLAAREGNLGAIQLFLTIADLEQHTMQSLAKGRGSSDKTAEEVALEAGHEEVADYLARFCKRSALDVEEQTHKQRSPSLNSHDSGLGLTEVGSKPLTEEETRDRRAAHSSYMKAARKRAVEKETILQAEVDQLMATNQILQAQIAGFRFYLEQLQRLSGQIPLQPISGS